MKTYFDEATDKRLLEAATEGEVRAIIAKTPEAEKLADKTDLVMAEIARIKGSVDNELDIDELEGSAGGDKMPKVTLSPTQSCKATFLAEDIYNSKYCWSNDQCSVANEYEYHHTRYSKCRNGGVHDWHSFNGSSNNFECSRCNVVFNAKQDNFDE